jgi:PleD family two-component response regulator
MAVARKIKSIDSSIPIILISRHSCEVRVIKALRAGVTDYYKYPVLSFEASRQKSAPKWPSRQIQV